jgi:hypothetical protein
MSVNYHGRKDAGTILTDLYHVLPSSCVNISIQTPPTPFLIPGPALPAQLGLVGLSTIRRKTRNGVNLAAGGFRAARFRS